MVPWTPRHPVTQVKPQAIQAVPLRAWYMMRAQVQLSGAVLCAHGGLMPHVLPKPLLDGQVFRRMLLCHALGGLFGVRARLAVAICFAAGRS